jgi:hypothetical protein
MTSPIFAPCLILGKSSDGIMIIILLTIMYDFANFKALQEVNNE